MNFNKKQNIIIMGAVIIITVVFGFSSYINKQKRYVLSSEAKPLGFNDSNDLDSLDNFNTSADEEKNHNNMEVQNIVVHVEGEVINPGVYQLKEDARIFDAIEAAGGMLETADRKKVNLAKKVTDEEYIYVANEKEEAVEMFNDNTVSNPVNQNNSNKDSGLININSADINQLKTLSGIGDVLAGRIIDYRDEKGGFKSVDDLKNVSGIGDKKFSDIRDKVTIK